MKNIELSDRFIAKDKAKAPHKFNIKDMGIDDISELSENEDV